MLQTVTDVPTDQEARYLLHHGSYVDEVHQIMYVETPKVACTSVKYMLRGLVNCKPLKFLPYEEHTNSVMWVHTRDQMPFRTLGSFTPKRRQEILSEPGWFRFCVIRHPYERFFSAWRDKIFIVEPGFEMHQLDKTKKFVEFTDFADKVLQEDKYNCDAHWRLQISLLLPDYINYTHIYDISRVSDVLLDLRRHLDAMGMTDKQLTLPRSNESWSIRPDGFLTPDITARLRAYYDLDFIRFNFPEREPSTATPITAASLVDEYTDAIYDRNRVMMAHVEYVNRKRLMLRAVRFAMKTFRTSTPGIRARALLDLAPKKPASRPDYRLTGAPTSADI